MKMNRLRYGEYYTKTYVDEKNYLHWLPADQDARKVQECLCILAVALFEAATTKIVYR